MSATDRQNRLLVAEDWKKVYQSFRNADFQSYDFENLRRTMIDYLRQNYPEDFNDYIESSEYLALIDVVAFLGQSIAFRVDLNARENFLELAERRESILRLARLVSYNAKRNIAAKGLLKFSTISTTQSVVDSNGRNLAGQVITWNDPTNTNWYDQFIKVFNAAVSPNQQFGNPSDKASIYGIPTEQYRFEASNTDVPVYAFSKPVAGRTMNFEISSTTFKDADFIYEESPKIGNSIACVYRNDGRGFGSPSSGFFFNFVQGTLNQGLFTILQPSTNESVDIDSQGINNTDVWLYRLDQTGVESEEWVKVPSFEGNNIIYNSLNKNIRNIYNVVTRLNDAVSISFSDGTFGTLPSGTFRVYYRISNGLSYTINTQDIRNVSISFPYVSEQGQTETLTISLALATSVSNAELAETNDSIKTNAPQTYYTQNRMITGEDYNIAPLSASQQVLKVKAVNRTSSGISRYFDLIDPTGKYSSTNLFADDGVIYSETYTTAVNFSYQNKTDIEGIIYNQVYDVIKKQEIKNFYYLKFINFIQPSISVVWYNITSDSTSSSGYLGTISDPTVFKIGTYTTNDLKYFRVGSLVKFTAPAGYYFDTLNYNKLVYGTATNLGAARSIWATVISVELDGTGLNGTGKTSSGVGPITLNQNIPSTAILDQIIPAWRTSIDSSTVTTMVDLIFANKPFGLRYNTTKQAWQIIFESNLDSYSSFNLGKQGDLTNKNQDSSWILLFTTDNVTYTITSREQRYIFESDKQIKFYFDNSNKIYDSRSNIVVKDSINVLNINTVQGSTNSFTSDIQWEIVSSYVGLDGYIDNKKIVITFADYDDNGVVDNPELFLTLVDPNNNSLSYTDKFIVEEKYLISAGQEDYRYINNDNGVVIILATQPTSGTDGQYYYFIDSNVVKKFSNLTGFVLSLDYKVYPGRDGLKFQYIHNSDYESRLDPSASNIIDVYVLTKNYDTMFRQWLSGANMTKPLPPSTDELYNMLSPSLNLIKSISDEVIYHPGGYSILFGVTANENLQATFKVTKTPGQVISDNAVKTKVISAINEFFVIANWDFGDTFYFSELSAYVMKQLSPAISSFVIVPKKANLNFGSLFEIKSTNDQLFVNGATVDDVEIISGITSSAIRSISSTLSDSNVITQQAIVSSTYGANNG
jgi:hypothetical protein